jgi:hypothetical protein
VVESGLAPHDHIALRDPTRRTTEVLADTDAGRPAVGVGAPGGQR